MQKITALGKVDEISRNFNAAEPPTTQAAVRKRLTLSIARSPNR
jgi:hypothetical protein